MAVIALPRIDCDSAAREAKEALSNRGSEGFPIAAAPPAYDRGDVMCGAATVPPISDLLVTRRA